MYPSWIANTVHNKDECAAKHDDAKVPLHFWNNALAFKLGQPKLTEKQEAALIVIRDYFCTCFW